jgi:hypothetical protein
MIENWIKRMITDGSKFQINIRPNARGKYFLILNLFEGDSPQARIGTIMGEDISIEALTPLGVDLARAASDIVGRGNVKLRAFKRTDKALKDV